MTEHQLYGLETFLADVGPNRSSISSSMFECVSPVLKVHGVLVAPVTYQKWTREYLIPLEQRYTEVNPYLFDTSYRPIQEGNFIVVMGDKFLNDANFVSPESHLDSTVKTWNSLSAPDGGEILWTEGTAEDISEMLRSFSEDIFNLGVELKDNTSNENSDDFAAKVFDVYLRIRVPQVFGYSAILESYDRKAFAFIATGRMDEYRKFKKDTRIFRELLEKLGYSSSLSYVWNF